jgi:DNA helicase HerA-like ATPase
LNVVYLNAMANDDEKHFFVAALSAEVYRWMVTSVDPIPGRPSLLFCIDEARDSIPAGGAKPPAQAPLIRLITQERKYGVACLLCTQSPRSVDYNVFGNCSTKLIGRLESAQDLDRVAD